MKKRNKKKHKQENQPSHYVTKKVKSRTCITLVEACNESGNTFFMRDKKKLAQETNNLIAKGYFDCFIRSMKKHSGMYLNFNFFLRWTKGQPVICLSIHPSQDTGYQNCNLPHDRQCLSQLLSAWFLVFHSF
jgi:hypothetical protein